MEIKKFKEIMHLLPQDCWAVKRNRSKSGEMEAENVLCIYGNFTIDKINLDKPIKTFKDHIKTIPADVEDNNLFMIWVEGNLTSKSMYNDETDGSTGLIVSGNLIADNIVVGGQEIYVTGNLTVNECFWGHYNHGELRVLGNTTAKLFVTTEEYHYEYEKTRIKAAFFLDDEDEEYSRETIQPIFIKEVLENEEQEEEVYSWSDWINRTEVLQHLADGKPIIQKKIITRDQLLKEELEQVPKIFASPLFTDEKSFQAQEETFNKILALIDDDEPEIFFPIDSLDVTVYISKAHQRSSDGKKTDPQIFILTNDGAEIYIWKKQLNPLKALTSKKTPLIIYYRDIGNNVISPKNVFEHEPLLALSKTAWQTIISYTERGLFYQHQLAQTAKPVEILRLLDLPLVREQYNDYSNSEFWQGNYLYMMRRHGIDGSVGSVDIGVEIPGENYDCRKYHFRPNAVEHPTAVELYYCSSQEGNTSDRYNHNENLSKVLVFDWQLYREALSWYPKIVRALETKDRMFHAAKENQKLEEEKQKQLIEEMKSKPLSVPFETLVFQGIPFKVITLHQAHEIIGGLTDFDGNPIYDVYGDTWRFPTYQDNPIILLAEEDVYAQKLEMEYSTDEHPDVFIMAFIFKKNLSVNTFIASCDTDNSPALIVLGKTTVTNITLFGNICYLGNGLACDSLIGIYNHGELYIKGDTNAWLIYADDMWMCFERFTGIGAVFCPGSSRIALMTKMETEDGQMLSELKCVPNTNYLSDIVNDTFIEINENGNEELGGNYYERAFETNLSLIDHNKKPRYDHESFGKDFREMTTYLSQIESFKESGYISLEDDNQEFSFMRFEHEQTIYLQLLNRHTGELSMSLRTLLNTDTNEILLVQEYLDENGEAIVQWQGDENAGDFEFKCVKHAMYKALDKLKKENDEIEFENDETPTEAKTDTPLPVDEKYRHLEKCCKEWIDGVTKIVSRENDYCNLTHGITQDDIKRHVQIDESIFVPDELINFYKIQNVKYNPVTSAFSFVVNNWNYDLIPFEDIASEWEDIQDLQFENNEELDLSQYSEKVKAGNYANPNWIPFATGRNGDYLLYDTDPSEKGTYGQIIELQNESWERNVIANSLSELIQNEINLIRNGNIEKFDFILKARE